MKSAQFLVQAGEVSPAVRVDDWPNPPRQMKTLTIHTYDFVGRIVIQATLFEHPSEQDWINIYEEDFDLIPNFQSKVRNRFFNSQDRFIHMRATVEKLKGRVDRIMVI
jgi:hypothetical protein